MVAGESDVHPTQIRGVKIKHPGGDGDVRPGCLYETGTAGRTYRSVIEKMHQNGVYHLFIKYPQENQVSTACGDTELRREILNILGQMAAFNGTLSSGPYMRAWVWERDWFWRTDQGGLNSNGYNDFVNDMSAVINQARSEGVSGPLEGVAPIETNLPGSAKVREYAIKVAQDINAKTSGWLTGHTLFFPGAGMGSWFKNIGDAGTQFFTDIKSQVKHFAFTYKFMKSHDGGVNTNLEPYYYYADGSCRWCVELGSGRTLDQQRAYIESTLGFGDLRRFIEAGRAQNHTWVANVIFWGDSGDGIVQMNRTNVQLMHGLLVQEMNQAGHFFDLAIVGSTEEDPKTRSKHILIDDAGTVHRNTANAWEQGGVNDSMTVWDEWYSWRLLAPGY